MAKVKIQGHASGTGILTVTAPNTSTDRTITLPDATGTLATTDDTTDLDGAVTINDTGADVDFRVEGSGEANALFVQGSDGNVGIGIGAPTSMLHIESTLGNSSPPPMIYVRNTNGPAELKLQAGGDAWTLDTDYDADNLIIRGSGTEVIRFVQDGRGLSQFTAKAWCAWDATGTPAITDSHNVSSLTDAGTGEQKLNFTNNLATADAYTVSALASKGGGAPAAANNATCTIGSSLPVTGPYIGVVFNGSASDRDYVCATCFGD